MLRRRVERPLKIVMNNINGQRSYSQLSKSQSFNRGNFFKYYINETW